MLMIYVKIRYKSDGEILSLNAFNITLQNLKKAVIGGGIVLYALACWIKLPEQTRGPGGCGGGDDDQNLLP